MPVTSWQKCPGSPPQYLGSFVAAGYAHQCGGFGQISGGGLGAANDSGATNVSPGDTGGALGAIAISGTIPFLSLDSSMPSEPRSQLAKPLASSSGQVPSQSQTHLGWDEVGGGEI